MAPVTCDTQAYFNILFPSISFFFFKLFFCVVTKPFSSFIRNFRSAQNCMGGGKGEYK